MGVPSLTRVWWPWSPWERSFLQVRWIITKEWMGIKNSWKRWKAKIMEILGSGSTPRIQVLKGPNCSVSRHVTSWVVNHWAKQNLLTLCFIKPNFLWVIFLLGHKWMHHSYKGAGYRQGTFTCLRIKIMYCYWRRGTVISSWMLTNWC